MRKLRVYADTSVFGGCFDPEFQAESRKFFEEARQGRFTVVISDVTVEELPARTRGGTAGAGEATTGTRGTGTGL